MSNLKKFKELNTGDLFRYTDNCGAHICMKIGHKALTYNAVELFKDAKLSNFGTECTVMALTESETDILKYNLQYLLNGYGCDPKSVDTLTNELKIQNYISAAHLYTDRYGCCPETDKELKSRLSDLLYKYEGDFETDGRLF